MSTVENKAVFLSYASQDAEAAQRIAAALRAAGVEVWFDQSELVGGDAWDAKIRGQVKSCALFVPVISAATQARREGYFRIEWKLAAQRTHAIAEGTPFLLPVVIDETCDSEALVPAEFREVQWTSLREPSNLGAFSAHVADVLAGSPGAATISTGASRVRPTRVRPGRVRQWSVVVGLCGLLGCGLWWRFASRPGAARETSAQASEAAAELDARLTALLRNSREDAALAEALTEKETNANPESARAWSDRAFVQSVYLTRGWDNTERRRQDAQRFAQRALARDENDVRALSVLATVFVYQGAFDEAAVTLRRALQIQPGSARLTGMLACAISGQGKTDDAIAMMEDRVRRNAPGDLAGYYNLALLHEVKEVPDFEAALRCFEAAMSADPPANVLLHKAALLAGARGDLAGARATLEKVAATDRIEDRPVGTAMMLGLLEKQPARVIAAGGQTARDFFDDLYVHGPKAWRLAHARRLEGKEALAQQEWQQAEAVLRRRLAAGPGTAVDSAALAVTLAWLGREEEAAKIMAPIAAQVQESPPRLVGWAPDHLRLLYLAYYYAGLGDAPNAVAYLRRLVNRRELLTDHTLPLDPWWDKLRGRPEFETLIAEGAARRTAPKISGAGASTVLPPEKSIAVLAFENLSDDKANEYFSDGISEELINALGRVPGLTVKGSTSAFYFKGRAAMPAEIARQLGVAYLVRGSVGKDGSKVRIAARLTRTADDSVVWASEPVTRELQDVFALRQEIATHIAQNLQLKLGVERDAAKTVNPEAHRLVLEGRYFLNQRDRGFAQAERAFEQALRIDADFADAHSGLATVRIVRASYQNLREPPALADLARGRVAARRAIELDAAQVQAHSALGYEALMSGRATDSGEHFRQALALNPNDPSARHWHAHLLAFQGRLDLALAENERAVQLDPLSFSTMWIYARHLRQARQPAKALEIVRRCLSLRPDFAAARCIEASELLALGRKSEAVPILRSLIQTPRDPLIPGPQLVWALRTADLTAEATKVADELVAAGENVFGVLVASGRAEQAFVTAADTASVGPFSAVAYYWDPMFDSVRMDPRFQQRVAATGLAEYYQVAQATLARLRADLQR